MSIKPIPLSLTDPHTSAWVSASAGTGKTKLLIDRLARLLLAEEAPSTLMCLTYTRAAAGEMLERLQKILNEWQNITDDELYTTLTRLLGAPPSPDNIKRARALASICRDDPVPIQTLHSFATTILRRAGDTRRLIEGHELQTLWRQTCHHTFQRGEHHAAWSTLAQHMTWSRVDDLLWQLYQNRFKWMRVQGFYGTLEDENEALSLLVPPPPSHRLSFEEEWETWRDHTFFSSFGDKKPWLDWIQQPHIQALFLTLKGEPRKRVPAHPLMEPWQQAVCEGYQYTLHHTWLTNNLALKAVALPLLQAMDQAKQAQHVWDYGDLLEQAMWLLENDPHTMERLHNQLHHILVDEAQDTSPEQWAIIRFLVRTFLVEPKRTLFVVGDLKQSIYSFQGADPNLFAALEHDFAAHFQNQRWISATLDASWRSTAPVLQLVDTVFKMHKKGVHTQHEDLQHQLTRHRDPGRVELWPLVAPAPYTPEQPWRTTPVQQPISWPLAQEIAEHIALLLSRGEILPSTNAPVQPHDIWVLFTRRGPLMSQIEQALLEENIPTSGVDRLSLWDHLLVKDFMALARFVLLPHDDMSLACLLKSPLLETPLTEEELFTLCHRREDPLWLHLLSTKPKHAHELKRWMQTWQKTSPSMWFTDVWQTNRKRYRDALGHVVDDVAGAFLEEVHRFEQQYAPSLEAFVAQDRLDLIKRHAQPHQGVHLTTVHSSKGLQAPIIILADATDVPRPQQDDFVWSYAPPFMALRPTQNLTALADLYQQHKYAVESENRRLLYVALTRAADQLYATGLQRKGNASTWYDLMQEALTQLGQENSLSYGTFEGGAPWRGQPSREEEETNASAPAARLAPIYKQYSEVESSEEARRGVILHKWLELMSPTSDPHAFLKKYDSGGLVDVQQLLTCQSWLSHPEWSWMFLGQAEVDIVGAEGELYRLDRLVVKEKEVWILDFKSGLLGANQTDLYRKKMHTYRKIVQELHPHHTVHACLVDIKGQTPYIISI